MNVFGVLLGLGLIVIILVDCYEAILQPRRVTRPYRFVRLFYRVLWTGWLFIVTRMPREKLRAAMLGSFGPLSLLSLFASWVTCLIFGFAIVHYSLRSPLNGAQVREPFMTDLYFSGTTFFTLGYGDVTPITTFGRTLAIVESGLGFAFLAVIISYLPVLYQAFSRREAMISLMDARAGSPPSAGQFLLRVARSGRMAQIDPYLEQWEMWAAELLESHLSFPVLSYYRSQHDNQSWLATLTTILDTTALLLVSNTGKDTYHAQLTFAMARHAAVDLSLILKQAPLDLNVDRAPPDQRHEMFNKLRAAGLPLKETDQVDAKLSELRGLYEPFLHSLAKRFIYTLPPMMPAENAVDNWQRSAWMKRSRGIGDLPTVDSPQNLPTDPTDEHFK